MRLSAYLRAAARRSGDSAQHADKESDMADYDVTQDPSGGWRARREGAARASSHHET